VASKGQFSLVEIFETIRPANPLFCHQDFLEKLAGHARDSVGKRVAFLLQRLCVDSQRLHYKATHGINRGWRRSRLGGNHGSHFYAWWAPKNAAPLKESADFSQVPEGALFLRDIRHHDDHSLLPANSLESHYLPITVRDLRREEYGPLPWTQPQMRFATSRQSVRLLKGHPGSGKTSALFHAADTSGGEDVLYVTYSRDLASLAREYFDRFCSSHKRFHVVTFPDLVRQVLGLEAPAGADQEAKRRFFQDLAPFSRTLGPWANNQVALYDELYAHLAGDALPLDLGRFDACTGPRVSEKSYRKRRARHLGESAVRAALEIAARLEKLNSRTLTESYFPELALAWQAMERLRGVRTGNHQPAVDPALLKMDCIAVDECQDLTPLEAFFLVELTALTNNQRRSAATLLLSGDEAQTVRPTDFEWGWLSDLLHSQISTPSEYKLSVNLRSPQRIAELVNRVWDLYAHVEKHERPSGTGYAEIEDDATDQVLYCSARPGVELDDLLVSLSAREGLALITLEDAVPPYVPEKAWPVVLTVSEAKGLDFNSVCVLDGGRHLERIMRDHARQNSGSDIEGLRKRLAIDQLRVALSRPTERLFWVDINPTEQIVRQSVAFLNGNDVEGRVASCVPGALLKTLEEDVLDLEERVQLCQSDARQYLDVKPSIAWSRAQQAVSLLGRRGSSAAVTDEAARSAAFLTLSEVCFILGSRNVELAPQLGKPDLFYESQRAAANAKRFGLAVIIDAIGRLHHAKGEARLDALVEVARMVSERKAEIESWLLVEIGSRSKAWFEELEAAVFNGHNAVVLLKLLPPFYEALAVPDRQVRTERLQQRAIQLLLKERQFAVALEILRGLAERQPKLEAACHEGLGDFRRAAECHMATGNRKDALACYRSIPDLDGALKLIDETGDHPAAESLRWISELRTLAMKRPDKFAKVVMPAEKKLLEEILERSLGVTRRKPAAPKAISKKSGVPRKRSPKTAKSNANPYF
jgi:hypothetical protein